MKQIILGTDWWTDCDDAVAVRLLANFHRTRQIQWLGVIINSCMEQSVASLDAFLQASGVEIPIGIDLNADDFGGKPPYQKRLAALSSRFKSNLEAENPVKLYRRLLASAPGQVDVLEIGFPQVLAALLDSRADEHSPLDGVALVKNKVSQLWIMAGKWDEPNGGREHNFACSRRASIAAAQLCEKWPTPVTFLGFEVGYSVISGSQLRDGDILKQVLCDHGSPNGRSSWDPMLVLLAVAGSPENAGYCFTSGRASVDPDTGKNYFQSDKSGLHRFVIKTRPDSWYAAEIDRRL